MRPSRAARLSLGVVIAVLLASGGAGAALLLVTPTVPASLAESSGPETVPVPFEEFADPRQIEAGFDDFDDGDDDQPVLASILRAELEREAKRFAEAHGYVVDWDGVGRLDDEALVNGIAQIAPFDIAAKQALLEAADIPDRADLLVQFMRFFGGRDDDETTLQ